MTCLVAASCAGTTPVDDDAATDPPATDAGGTTADADPSATGDTGDGDGADDDDAAAILGNPDLDLDDLPPEVAEALDDIDDVVSIGPCESTTVGLAVTAPDGWRCRVLDQPAAGMDGFTLFTDGNQLNLTIGTASPFGPPCEVLNLCDQSTPISLSGNFPDTERIEIAGTVTIWGSHPATGAELIITKPSALTDDEVELISQVLDSAVAL
ncbi:MAG: hypothetical protein AAFN30_10635 [Actinomycetota bacterium]